MHLGPTDTAFSVRKCKQISGFQDLLQRNVQPTAAQILDPFFGLVYSLLRDPLIRGVDLRTYETVRSLWLTDAHGPFHYLCDPYPFTRVPLCSVFLRGRDQKANLAATSRAESVLCDVIHYRRDRTAQKIFSFNNNH